MIDEVMICGLRRNNELVPKIEIEQSIGRAGRSYTKNGSAIILANKFDESKAFDYLFEETPPIKSKMDELSEICFHILPVIKNHKKLNKDDFNDWYAKTLSCMQGKKVSYKNVVRYLNETECVYIDNEGIHCTPLGVLSCDYFVTPDRIKSIKDKINNLPVNFKNSYCLSWVLSYEDLRHSEFGDEFDEFVYSCKRNDCFFDNNEEVHGFIYFCVLKHINHPLIKFQISQEKNNIDRVINVTKNISTFCGNKDFSDYLQIVYEGLQKNMSPEVSEFSHNTGIDSKSEIKKLFDLEVKTIDNIIDNEITIKRTCNKKTISLLEKFWR